MELNLLYETESYVIVCSEYSSSSLFDLQLSLDQTLSDICESSGSFVTEDNCCTDKSAKVVMFGENLSHNMEQAVGHLQCCEWNFMLGCSFNLNCNMGK